MMKRLLLILIILNAVALVVNIVRGDWVMVIDYVVSEGFGIFAYKYL